MLFDVELTIDELVLARQALRLFADTTTARRVTDVRDAVALADRLNAIAAGSGAQR